MAYADAKDVLGKQPFTVVGIVADKCSLTAGVLPCEATETGNAKCFNTRKSCNNPPNYTRTTTEIKFCQPRSNLPIGEVMIPAIRGDVKTAPTSVTGGKGLGNRAVLKVTIDDFPHHDRGIDPYLSERTYNPETRGTFWGRWLARNPYYEGRTLKVYQGYLNAPFSWADFEIYEYDITDIKGPTDGKVEITAKDVLIRTYSDKSQYPIKSTGKLSADITDIATSATLTPAGIGDAEYPASGYVSIGKEILAFTRAGDVLTLTRAQWGTTTKSHTLNDEVQLCVSWSGTNVVDVLYELLVTGAKLPAAFVPYAGNWTDEKTQWLSTAVVTGILMKPEGVEKIITELSEQFMFDIWWDAELQEVRIKALSPEPGGVTINTLTDGYNILADSMKINRDAKQRVTQVQVWYNKIDYSEKDDIEFFASAQIAANTSTPSADLYGSESIKVIISRWISDGAQAIAVASRLLNRFIDTPEVVEFEVATKDDKLFSMSGRVEIDSWQFQDFTGANQPRKFQITEISESDHGHKVKVRALSSSFGGRYWFIAPDTIPDYSSATEEQKKRYGFIAPDTGTFTDGEPAYKII